MEKHEVEGALVGVLLVVFVVAMGIVVSRPLIPIADRERENDGREHWVDVPEAREFPIVVEQDIVLDMAFASLGKQGMIGLGPALVAAEAETGVNAVLLAAICAHESGWGASRLARERNNLAGLGAYDHSPGSAIRFESREECVMFLAELLRDRPGTLEQVGTWYASDPAWAQKVAGCMKIIAGRVTP